MIGRFYNIRLAKITIAIFAYEKSNVLAHLTKRASTFHQKG